jgi:hypothetical protein
MTVVCFQCGAVQTAQNVGRSSLCEKCGADLRCCRNCEFYSLNSHNECAEPQAERVLDKERSNFCDYFRPNPKAKGGAAPKKDVGKALDDLFKK